eukprot:62217_1
MIIRNIIFIKHCNCKIINIYSFYCTFKLSYTILNCILLTILFIHSLKKVINSADNRKAMTDTMVKFVVLVSLTMATTLLGSIALIFGGIVGGIALEGFVLLIGPIDMVTNAFCIYLQFDDANYKLCGKYHGFVEHLFKADDIFIQNDIEVQIANIHSKIHVLIYD